MSAGSTQFTAYCATALCTASLWNDLSLYDSYGDGWNGNELDVAFTGETRLIPMKPSFCDNLELLICKTEALYE